MQDLSEVGISKSQENKFDNYKFRGIDDVYNTLSKVLAKHGLLIMPNVINQHTVQVSTQKGGTMNHTTLQVIYTFISSHDGTTHRLKMRGEAMDRGDKSINKAFSAAYKYLCLQVFCIPLQGNEDADSESHSVIETTINEVQKNTLDALIKQKGADLTALLAHYKIEKLDDLPSNKFMQAKNALEKKPDVSA